MNRTRSLVGSTPAEAPRPALPAPAGTALMVTAAIADGHPSDPAPWGIR